MGVMPARGAGSICICILSWPGALSNVPAGTRTSDEMITCDTWMIASNIMVSVGVLNVYTFAESSEYEILAGFKLLCQAA